MKMSDFAVCLVPIVMFSELFFQMFDQVVVKLIDYIFPSKEQG